VASERLAARTRPLATGRIILNGHASATRPPRARPAAAFLALILVSIAAYADPWIPAAGDGSFEPSVRQYDATSAFPPGAYGTSTAASSEERYTMLRITGTHGIGHRLSIEYDLRAGRIQKIRVKHGRQIVNSATGVEDQEIGLNLGLRQRRHFADSIALNVVAPTGAVGTSPPLGVGQTAIEPDYQVGFAHGRFRASLEAGSRVFVDSGTAQMRVDVDTSFAIFHRVAIGATLFYVRTVLLRKPLPLPDAGEQYDVLRPGLRVKYRATRRFKPYVEYERDLAGEAIHAGRRFTVGFTYEY